MTAPAPWIVAAVPSPQDTSYRKPASWSMTDGSVEDSAKVAVSPLAALGAPPMNATGGALTTVRVVGADTVVPPDLPSETCTVAWRTAGPSLTDRPSS